MHLRITACALLALLFFSLPASATTVTSTAGCTTSVANITSTIDFTSNTTTDSAGHATYQTPFFSGGTSTCSSGGFLSDGTNQTTTILFDQAIDYFGLAWGTKDNYNFVKIYNGSTLLGTFTGNTGGSGGTLVPGGSGLTYINFFADAGEVFTKIELSSVGNCCFESDNHSYRLAAVPEPPTVLGLATGFLLGVVWLFRSRRLVLAVTNPTGKNAGSV